jgi:hypothetical protein
MINFPDFLFFCRNGFTMHTLRPVQGLVVKLEAPRFVRVSGAGPKRTGRYEIAEFVH